ncbi:hypothetical protein GWK47_026918 [Chionoecetes opilio]|uniref:Uncharacterized protein n=1 Tax=Chionoecetes opilio TaxID=41210 RepID=A0A8J8WNH1_CHIOP|nr:hypothetical protein GWK47_026918 [Chionoecetes opilio]
MPVFEAVVSKQKLILVLTPASSTSFKPLQPRFCQSNPSLPGPQKELGVIFPCEEDGDAVLRIAREGREEFSVPMQDQPLRYLLVPQFHDLLGGLLSPPQFVLDRPCSSGDRHTPNVHSKKLER